MKRGNVLSKLPLEVMFLSLLLVFLCDRPIKIVVRIIK